MRDQRIHIITLICMLLWALFTVQLVINRGYAAEGSGLSLSVVKEGSDTIIIIKLNRWGLDESPSGVGTFSGNQLEVEVDGVSEVIILCDEWSCTGLPRGPGAVTANCTVPSDPNFDINKLTYSYNLGEITGTPPMVRARVQQIQCDLGTPIIDWSSWRQILAAVYSPPIIEAAIVIGVAGIAVAVGNNYWSGRQQRKATEVTRTVGVGERFMELYDASREPDFQRMMTDVLYQYEWTDYDDFIQKYGPRTNADAWSKIQSLAQYFEGIGVMVQTQSIDIDQVSRLLSNQIIPVWDKLDEVIIEQRRRDLNPTIYQAFESLYYAIKNYQKQEPTQQDDVRVHRFE